MTTIAFYLMRYSDTPPCKSEQKYSKVKLGYFCLFSTLIPLANHLSLLWENVQERRVGANLGAFAKSCTSAPSNGWRSAIAQAVMADSANAASVQGEVS